MFVIMHVCILYMYVCCVCIFVVYVSLFQVQNNERTGERIYTKFSGNVRIVLLRRGSAAYDGPCKFSYCDSQAYLYEPCENKVNLNWFYIQTRKIRPLVVDWYASAFSFSRSANIASIFDAIIFLYGFLWNSS